MANLRITVILFPSFTISTTLSIKKTFKNQTFSNLATPSRERRLILKDFKRGTIIKLGISSASIKTILGLGSHLIDNSTSMVRDKLENRGTLTNCPFSGFQKIIKGSMGSEIGLGPQLSTELSVNI